MSTKKRPTDEQLEAMLTEPHFGASQELSPGDPITPTPMVVSIHEVDPYDKNPRVERNSAYDVIKEAIRRRGFRGALSITRRPGAERYMASEGGNTTLAIVKELYEETGDKRFATIQCIFEPWKSETEVMIAHLAENDARSDLIFIDKAMGIRNLKRELEAELGIELSQKKLSEILKERGYPVSRRLLYNLDYAVDVLLPVIPVALRSGMGQPQVNAIQRLEKAALEIWEAYEAGDEALFKAVFTEALAGIDGPDWSIERARREVEAALATRCSHEVQHISIEIGARLSDSKRMPEEELSQHMFKEQTKNAAPAQPELHEPPRHDDNQELQENGNVTPLHSDDTSSGTGTPPSSIAARSGGAALEEPTGTSETGKQREVSGEEQEPIPPTATDANHLPSDIKSLRARAWTLATQLAQRHGMKGLVVNIPTGFGYLLVGTPEFGEELDRFDCVFRSNLWWMLAACAEADLTPLAIAQKYLPEDSIMRIHAEQDHPDDLSFLQDRLDTVAVVAWGWSLWGAMEERDWHRLRGLMDTYRQIKKLTDEQSEPSIPLWEIPS